MRVVQVITRLILGGAQQHVLSLSRLLRDRHGCDVTIVAGPPLGPEGELLSAARAAGFKPVVVGSLRRAISPWHDGLALVGLLDAFRRLRPDVVHTHSAKAGVVGRLAARGSGARAVVHTVHGLPFHPGQNPFVTMVYASIERAASPLADKYVCVGEFLRKRLAAFELVGGRDSVTIPCGVDVAEWRRPRDRAAARRSFGLGVSPVVACVARLAPQKGHDALLDAARKMPEAEWLFVGDGERRRELEERARGLRVRFAGLVAPERVPDAIAASDAVALASTREGVPLVLVQAILAGRPVAALDMDGAPEVVEPGVTGCLVKEGDDFAEAVRHALGLRVPPAAIDRLAERFDEGRTAASVHELYRSLLA